MSRLVLVDTQNFFYRAFYAYPAELTTPDGKPIGGVFGFATMLSALAEELQPTHLVAADESEKELVFRQIEYPEYKATRPPKPPEEQARFDAQLPFLVEFLQTAGIPRLIAESYEADDLIGTISSQLTNQPVSQSAEIIIASNDRDLMQLISRRVRFYLPGVGQQKAKLYGEKEFFEEYGFKPPLLVDYKALRGDPSDNIPGVAGIGEKTASELVRRYGTLEEIYAHLLELKPAVAQKLNDGKESAFFSRKLVTIVTDAPVKIEPEKWRFGGLKKPAVTKLLREWNFKSLLKKLEGEEKNEEDRQIKLL